MDFQKLNNEFSNMQVMINKYNKLLLDINNKIKDNIKNINKYEARLKNIKNNIEEASINLYILSLKNETTFLESIIKEEVKDGDK